MPNGTKPAASLQNSLQLFTTWDVKNKLQGMDGLHLKKQPCVFCMVTVLKSYLSRNSFEGYADPKDDDPKTLDRLSCQMVRYYYFGNPGSILEQGSPGGAVMSTNIKPSLKRKWRGLLPSSCKGDCKAKPDTAR